MDESSQRRRLHLRDVSLVDDAAAEMPRDPANLLGAVLNAARVQRGKEIASVAAELKMRPEQIEAIEANDFAKLPGRTYAAGFVRAYARYLGLDAEAMVQRFKDECIDGDMAKPVEHVFPEAAEESRNFPNISILVWVLLVAALVYSISYLTVPNREQPTAASISDPVVVVEEEAAAIGNGTAQDAWLPLAAGQSQVLYVAGNSLLPATDAPTDVPLLAVDAVTPSSGLGVPEFTVTSPSQPAPQPSRITFTALEQTYVRIKDSRLRGSGSVIVSRLLNAGESYRAPDRPGMLLLTGNAGGLQVEVDGRVMGVLGKRGEVITRIPVDAAYFLERTVATE